MQIFERGESEFFNKKCYDLATKRATGGNTLSQGDQWFVEAYWALIHIMCVHVRICVYVCMCVHVRMCICAGMLR